MTDQDRRIIPDSDLDMRWFALNPEWGRGGVPGVLRAKLTRGGKSFVDSDGNEYAAPEKEELWDYLSFYTRDIRLGFLNKKDVDYCEFWLEMASNFLHDDLLESFYKALNKVISKIEVSQSREGNLRRNTKTTTSEQRLSYEEPPKRFGKRMEM